MEHFYDSGNLVKRVNLKTSLISDIFSSRMSLLIEHYPNQIVNTITTSFWSVFLSELFLVS